MLSVEQIYGGKAEGRRFKETFIDHLQYKRNIFILTKKRRI